MDIHAIDILVGEIMPILTQFVTMTGKVGIEAIGKLGEGVAAKTSEGLGESLITAIEKRFTKDGDSATRALDAFKKEPDIYQSALEKKLCQILLTDQDFFNLLNGIAQKGPEQSFKTEREVTTGDVAMENAHRVGLQSVNLGEKSRTGNITMHIKGCC